MFTEKKNLLPAVLLLAAAIVFCACENITSQDMGDITGEIGESLTVGVTPGIDSLDAALEYVNGKKTVLDTRYTIIIPDGETTVTPLDLTASDAVKTITLKPESASVTVKGGAAGRIFQIPYMVVLELGRGVTLSGIEKEGEPLIEAAGALVIGDGAEIIVSEWIEPPLESKQPALTWGGPSFSALLDMGEPGSSGSVLNVQVTGAVTMTGGRIGASNGDKDGAVKLLGRLAMSGKAWIDGGIYNAGQVSLSEAAVVSGAGIFFTTEASPIEVLGFLTPQYNAEAGSPAKTAKIVVADPQAGAVLSDGESAAALAVSDSKGDTLELNDEGAVGIGNVKNIRAESETGKLTLRWDDPNYDGYAGVRIGAFLGNTALPGSPVTKVKGALYHTFDGLTNGVEYTFKLQAFKSLSELSAAYTVKASPEKVFDSADELEAYLSARPVAEGTLGNPVSLRVSYVYDSQTYSALLTLIHGKKKYVRLDLGPSDFSSNNSKLEYVQALSERELWIVSLKLPESVWEIDTTGTAETSGNDAGQTASIFGIAKKSGTTKAGYWNLESIEMPGVKTIGERAFYADSNTITIDKQQENLRTVSMPVVEKIGKGAFAGRKLLTHIYAPRLTDVSGFQGCVNLQTIEISPEADKIGDWAFYNCEKLTSILPGTKKITTIGQYAFASCTSFDKFDFPSLKEFSFSDFAIGNNAFSNCTAMVSLALPEAVTRLPYSAFNGCVNLKTVAAPGVETIGANSASESNSGTVFSGCTSLKTVSMEKLKTVLGPSVFSSCSALEGISFLNLEEAPGNAVFSGCANLVSVNLPKLKSVGGNTNGGVFSGCTALVSIDLPNLETAGTMFSGCSNLTSVDLPKLTTTTDNMFTNCTSLISIYLPELTTAGNNMFSGCTNLVSVDLPNLETVGTNMLINLTSITSVNLLKLQTGGASMFSGCTSLTSITLPNLVTAGYSMFAKTNISSIALPKLATLGYSAFDGCENLKSVYLPVLATLTSNANNYLFRNCYKLSSIILGQSVPNYSAAQGSTSAMNNMFLNTGRDAEENGFIIYVANENAKTDLVTRITGKLNANDGWYRGLSNDTNRDSEATAQVITSNNATYRGTQKFAGSTTAADGVKLYSELPDNIKTLFDIKE